MNNIYTQTISKQQESYASEMELRVVDSLVAQFNRAMATQSAGQSLYTVTMFMNRPAGYYGTTNIKKRFAFRCIEAGWLVTSMSINECLLTVTVTPIN